MNEIVCQYEVRWIWSGFVAYRGPSLAAAATALSEGTCYGKGLSPRMASDQAEAEVAKFRAAKHCS